MNGITTAGEYYSSLRSEQAKARLAELEAGIEAEAQRRSPWERLRALEAAVSREPTSRTPTPAPTRLTGRREYRSIVRGQLEDGTPTVSEFLGDSQSEADNYAREHQLRLQGRLARRERHETKGKLTWH